MVADDAEGGEAEAEDEVAPVLGAEMNSIELYNRIEWRANELPCGHLIKRIKLIWNTEQ